MNQRNIVNRLLVIVLLAVVTSFFPVYAQQMNPLLYSTETNGQQSVDTIDAAEPLGKELQDEGFFTTKDLYDQTRQFNK